MCGSSGIVHQYKARYRCNVHRIPAPVKRGILVLRFGMALAPVAESLTPDTPFRYVGGSPAADLVNTVTWLPGALVHECLTSYERLTDWAQGAGVISAAQARRLRADAKARPVEARAALDEARLVRWTLQRVLTALARGQPIGGALDDFNALLADASRRLEFREHTERGKPGVAPAFRGFGEHLASPLWPVIRAAAELVTSPDVARLRVCANQECGWVYVDRSRNGLRRWCEMETCGTSAKTSRRRARRSRSRRGVERP